MRARGAGAARSARDRRAEPPCARGAGHANGGDPRRISYEQVFDPSGGGEAGGGAWVTRAVDSGAAPAWQSPDPYGTQAILAQNRAIEEEMRRLNALATWDPPTA